MFERGEYFVERKTPGAPRPDGRHVQDMVIVEVRESSCIMREARRIDYVKEWLRDQYIDVAFEFAYRFPRWVCVWQEDA